MKKWIEHGFNWGLGTAIAFCCFATVYSIIHHGLDAEAAAWVQAGGSVAALSGAAWLAKAEIRRRHLERRREREEAAWAVHFALQQGRQEANVIAWEIVGPDANPTPVDRRHWHLRTSVARQLLTHYAAYPDHLHPSMVHIAVNGVGLLDQLDEDLDAYQTHLASGDEIPTQLVNDITWYTGHFNQLMDELKGRTHWIAAELDKDADGAFPRRRFWGEPDPDDEPAEASPPSGE